AHEVQVLPLRLALHDQLNLFEGQCDDDLLERSAILRLHRRGDRHEQEHGQRGEDRPARKAHDEITFTRGRGSSFTRPRPRRSSPTPSNAGGPGAPGPGLAQPACLYRRSGDSGWPPTFISLIRWPMARRGSIAYVRPPPLTMSPPCR